MVYYNRRRGYSARRRRTRKPLGGPSKRRRLQGKSIGRMGTLGRALYTGATAGAKAARLYRNVRRKYNSESSSSSGKYCVARQTRDDYQRLKYTYGRRIGNRRFINRALNAAKAHHTFQLSNYGQWGVNGGQVSLMNGRWNAAGQPYDSHLELPCHLYDLSAVCQSNDAGAWIHPYTGMRLMMENNSESAYPTWWSIPRATEITALAENRSPGSATFDAQSMVQLIDDSAPEIRTGTHLTNIGKGVQSQSYLSGVSAKMLFYGSNVNTTKYRVDLVWLHEDVQPDKQTNTSRGFWQTMMKQYSWNPLEQGYSPILKKYMRVKKSMVVYSEAPETNETLTLRRQKQVDFYARVNRRMKYDWAEDPDPFSLVSNQGPQNAISSLTAAELGPSTHVHPNKRLYLMIRAMVEHVDGATADTRDEYPRYDIKLTLNHRTLDRNA